MHIQDVAFIWSEYNIADKLATLKKKSAFVDVL